MRGGCGACTGRAHMNCALLKHSPWAVQPGQSAARSLHLSLHTPHVTGQWRAMKPGLSLQPPDSAQPAHCFLVSLQSGVHTPHAIGHSLYIISGFSSHWPSCLGAG